MKVVRGLQATIDRPSRAPEVQERVREDDVEERLSVDVPKRIKRRLKAHCADEGMTIRDFLLRLLRDNGIS